MRLLLDTHAFLWFIQEDDKLTSTALKYIQDEENQLYLSVASLWEVAIKTNLGKMKLDGTFEQFFIHHLRENRCLLMPIRFSDIVSVSTLPHHHRDPFDRMLVAQTLMHKYPLISSDAGLDAYGIERIW